MVRRCVPLSSVILPWGGLICDIVVAAANITEMMMVCLFRHARAQGGGALGMRQGGVSVVAVGIVGEGSG